MKLPHTTSLDTVESLERHGFIDEVILTVIVPSLNMFSQLSDSVTAILFSIITINDEKYTLAYTFHPSQHDNESVRTNRSTCFASVVVGVLLLKSKAVNTTGVKHSASRFQLRNSRPFQLPLGQSICNSCN